MLSTVGHIVTGAGGAILSVGKGVVCARDCRRGNGGGQGAATVGGAAVGGAETGGAGTAAGAAAGSAVGGVIKKGVGVVTKLICSSGGGAASTLAKAAVGAAAAAATFDLAAHWMIGAAEKITAAIVSTITHSTSPQLTAAWFQRSFAPMAALGAAFALLVTLIALTSAAARRDPAALAGTLTGILRAGLGTGSADRADDARIADLRRDLGRCDPDLAPDVLVAGRARVGIERVRRIRVLGVGDADGDHAGDRRGAGVARARGPQRGDLPRGPVLPGRAGGVDLAEPRGVDEPPRRGCCSCS